ncbi:hypothetical protein ACQ4PT_010015 [Festuca glaucescens]
MDSSRKKARTCTCNVQAEDRLSALPDALIHAIMSFLKAHQVVQTCVLAKRWMHLWRSVPNLDIDLPEFNSKMTEHDRAAKEARYAKFVDFADYLMVHRHQNGTFLDTFRLHVDATHQGRPADAARWVRRGLKCSPRVLHIRCPFQESFFLRAEMPSELRCGPPGSCRLTKLHLLHVSLNHSFAEQISSVCDVLEELELKSCSIWFRKFTSPSLKNLIIDCCRACSNRLSITAPHLVSLHLNLEATYDSVVSVNEMVSLVKASIHNWIDYRGNVAHDNHCELLSSLSNVTSLELLGFPIRLLPDEEPVEFPMFKNLTTLLLDDCELGDKFQLLRHFLQNSPNLERLTVKGCKFSKGSKKGKGKARSKTSSQCQDAVHFSCWKLKYTEIIYKGSDNIGPLVNVLIEVSDRLPKNTLTLTKVEAAV